MRMQGRTRASRIRLATLIASALLLIAGLCWWWHLFSAASPAFQISGTPTSSRNKGGLRSGFAQGATLADEDIAEGCTAGPVIEWDPAGLPANKDLAVRVIAANEWLQSELIRSTNARQQALGLMLQSTGAMSSRHTDDPAALNALARMAATSSDPLVYALALRSCGKFRVNSSDDCLEISERGWAQIDPNNAVPWLDLATEASERHDAAAEAEELHQAAGASYLESDTDSLLAVAEPAMPPGLTPLEEYYVDVRLLGFQSALPLPYIRATRECSSLGDGTADVLKDCSALAELMVASGRTLIDFGLGVQLAERLSWPAQRIVDLRRERSALRMVEMGGPRDLSSPLSCREEVREMERARRWSASGELPALRTELQSSGVSAEDLATQYEQWEASAASTVKAAAQSDAH